MLFMVIERFKGGDPTPVGERFRAKGRMIPENSGVDYVASWMTEDGAACFQVMRAPTREALDPWIAAWCDLVDFEVVPVLTSAEFWAQR
jgi:hypothetical protein